MAVAALEPAVAQGLLKQAEKESWPRAKLRGEVIKVRRGERQQAIADASGAGRGPWSRLYADPPWQYGDVRREIGGAEGEYETLPTPAICDFLTEHEIAVHDDAVLFLWATVPLLPDGLAVMSAWGFEYKLGFPF